MQRVGGPKGELLNAYFLYYKYTILSPKMLYELLKQILVVRGPPHHTLKSTTVLQLKSVFFCLHWEIDVRFLDNQRMEIW